MSTRNLDEIEEIEGNEGSKIKQIFHPHNTLNGIRYSIAHFTIQKGKRTLIHKMKTSEIYFILEGEGIMHIDDEKFPIKKNSSVYIPLMSKQFIENSGDSELKFLCMADPAWKQDDEILLE